MMICPKKPLLFALGVFKNYFIPPISFFSLLSIIFLTKFARADQSNDLYCMPLAFSVTNPELRKSLRFQKDSIPESFHDVRASYNPDVELPIWVEFHAESEGYFELDAEKVELDPPQYERTGLWFPEYQIIVPDNCATSGFGGVSRICDKDQNLARMGAGGVECE